MSRFSVKKVAVLGAGVMGAQIAAHLVNLKVPVVLFDLPAKEGPKNGIVSKATGGLTKKTGTLTLTSPKTKLSGCFNLTINGITAKGYSFNAASGRTAQVCR